MEHKIDRELRGIFEKIRRENKSEESWAATEASDCFQTDHYCGGFDAAQRQFTFNVYLLGREFCFAMPLDDALKASQGLIEKVELQPSPWSD